MPPISRTLPDTARYLVDPGSVSAPGKHSAGGLTFARPYIVSGTDFFVFPVGTEGFTRSGSAKLGLHYYLGANSVDGMTLHREEGRIEMSGTFPGISSVSMMRKCIQILRAESPDGYLTLYVPGVFAREQRVLAENWSFTHPAEDRTSSIDYTISFVRLGEGQERLSDPNGIPPPPAPAPMATPRGKPTHIYRVTTNVRTLRAVSNVVYGNADEWQTLADLNEGQLN